MACSRTWLLWTILLHFRPVARERTLLIFMLLGPIRIPDEQK